MDSKPVQFEKVPIRPVDCLKEAKELIGEQYWLMVGICLVGILIAQAVPFAILMGPMFCGIYLCFFQRGRGEQTAFDTLFKGFDYFKESLIATLVMVGLSMLVVGPLTVVYIIAMLAFSAGGDDMLAPMFGTMVVYSLALTAFNVLFYTFFMFIYPLIVDRGLTAMPAIKTSCKAVLANLPGLVGLMLLENLLAIAGAMCCYVPAILLMPILFGANIIAYRRVFPDETQSKSGTAVEPQPSLDETTEFNPPRATPSTQKGAPREDESD